MPKLKDITGQQYGRLTVLSISHRRRYSSRISRVYWLCRCECGTEMTACTSDLGSGNTRSCGCLLIDVMKQLTRTHGHTSGGWSTTFRAWSEMKTRCYNPNRKKDFLNYQMRGITVCDRWLHSFENFLADMGEKPPGLTLERIDNERGYSPDNCKWATYSEQNKNRRPFKRHGAPFR